MWSVNSLLNLDKMIAFILAIDIILFILNDNTRWDNKSIIKLCGIMLKIRSVVINKILYYYTFL